MSKLTVINIFSIEELEDHVSPDTIYDVQEYKGETYILTRDVAFKYNGEKADLLDWMEETIYSF